MVSTRLKLDVPRGQSLVQTGGGLHRLWSESRDVAHLLDQRAAREPDAEADEGNQDDKDNADGGLTLHLAPAQSLHQGVQRIGDQAAEREQQQGVVDAHAQPDGDGEEGEQEQRGGEDDKKAGPFFHVGLLPE